MRRYETIIIIDPDVSEETRGSLFSKIEELIAQYDGLLINFDEWGNKKLAYEIGKKKRGYYVRLYFCGTGVLVNELERHFKINDQFLKYMTVLLEKNVDVERIKGEINNKNVEEDLTQSEEIVEAENIDSETTLEKSADVPPDESVPEAETKEDIEHETIKEEQ